MTKVGAYERNLKEELYTNNKKFSISAAQGRVAHEHDDRDYTPRNADWSLKNRNVTIKQSEDYEALFNDLFRESIAEYNFNQKRADRKKSYDYFSEIKNGKGPEKPTYEYVVQVGNRENLGVTDNDFDNEKWYALKCRGKFKEASDYVKKHLNKSPHREELKSILTEEMRKLEERYTKFHFWTIVGHDDEPCGTMHFHIAFTPVADGYKNGMSTRDSLSKALTQMGFKTDQYSLGIEKWQNDVKKHIEKAMINAGYEREYKNNTEAHLSVDQFKLKSQNEHLLEVNAKLDEEIKAKQKHLEDLIASESDFELRRKDLDKKEEEISVTLCELTTQRKAQERIITDLNKIKNSINSNPPTDLVEFAKSYKRTQRIRKYHPFTHKQIGWEKDSKGNFITEEHNCYDDWKTKNQSYNDFVKNVNEITQRINFGSEEKLSEIDLSFN